MMKEEVYIMEEAARKTTELKSDLHTLPLEKAAAVAEAEVLEAAAEEELGETDRKSSVRLSLQNLTQPNESVSCSCNTQSRIHFQT